MQKMFFFLSQVDLTPYLQTSRIPSRFLSDFLLLCLKERPPLADWGEGKLFSVLHDVKRVVGVVDGRGVVVDLAVAVVVPAVGGAGRCRMLKG